MAPKEKILAAKKPAAKSTLAKKSTKPTEKSSGLSAEFIVESESDAADNDISVTTSVKKPTVTSKSESAKTTKAARALIPKTNAKAQPKSKQLPTPPSTTKQSSAVKSKISEKGAVASAKKANGTTPRSSVIRQSAAGSLESGPQPLEQIPKGTKKLNAASKSTVQKKASPPLADDSDGEKRPRERNEGSVVRRSSKTTSTQATPKPPKSALKIAELPKTQASRADHEITSESSSEDSEDSERNMGSTLSQLTKKAVKPRVTTPGTQGPKIVAEKHNSESSEDEDSEGSDDEPEIKKSVPISTTSSLETKLPSPSAMEVASDSSSEEESEDSDDEPAKKASTPASKNAKSNSKATTAVAVEESTSESSSKEGTDDSEDESSDQGPENTTADTSGDSNASAHKPDTIAVEYQPPNGFSRATVAVPSLISSIFSEENLSGKQLWHVTAPSGVPISAIKEFSSQSLANGQSVVSHKGADYTFASDISQLAPQRVYHPSQRSNKYAPISRQVSRSISLQRIVKLPQLDTSRSDSTNLTANLTAEPVVRPREKPQQPKGLKVRYQAFGGWDVSDDSDDSNVEPRSQFKVPPGANFQGQKEKSLTEKRKAADTPVAGSPRQESPKKKRKKEKQSDSSSQAVTSSQPVVQPKPVKSRQKKVELTKGSTPLESTQDTVMADAPALVDGSQNQDGVSIAEMASRRAAKAKKKEDRLKQKKAAEA